ncbi:MAG: DNA repair exonuclease, partial [Phycisphaeraceae bacterium]|nr:DNA repair exonuclease [Phycisphaeraceae bacterium]
MKLLLAGDIHIGRASTRLPDGTDRESLRAGAAWERLVKLAIELRVDVVCLSGDIADQDNKFWEAIGPLEAGIGRLSEAGIWTVAVSGNHDFDVLPRLADGLSEQARTRFLLPGRGGVWERVTIRDGHGRAVLHVDGWCFAQERVRESPLKDYVFDPPGDGVPVLGIVHGDLGVSESVYAPLSLSDLMRAGPSGWLLGHIHSPRLERGAGAAGSCWVLYPGSLQALDPGETGGHGPWLLEVEHGRLGEPRALQLSSVWYETVEVAADGLLDVRDVRDRVFRECGERAEALISEVGVPPEH